MKPEPTVTIDLTLSESGVLCHTLLRAINEGGGPEKTPYWILVLYEKLADINDQLMGKKPKKPKKDSAP